MNEFQIDFEDDVEYLHRLGIFAQNLKKIEAHNNGNHSWHMAATRFAHLTSEEFKTFVGKSILPPQNSKVPRVAFVHNASLSLDDSVDWVNKGAVTVPKAQGKCGGCWAFSTTGAVEGAYFIKTGTLKSFSEQQLISCDSTNDACGGGLMDRAFEWIDEESGGLCLENDYPYVSGPDAYVPPCDTSCYIVDGTRVSTFTDVSPDPQRTPCTEDAMQDAVMHQPVSVAIEADQDSFQLYGGGVMTDDCGTQLDHGVLVVGYGQDGEDKYWKVKNSWGPDWGEEGYIRLGKGKKWGFPYNGGDGQCGILLSASFPTL